MAGEKLGYSSTTRIQSDSGDRLDPLLSNGEIRLSTDAACKHYAKYQASLHVAPALMTFANRMMPSKILSLSELEKFSLMVLLPPPSV